MFQPSVYLSFLHIPSLQLSLISLCIYFSPQGLLIPLPERTEVLGEGGTVFVVTIESVVMMVMAVQVTAVVVVMVMVLEVVVLVRAIMVVKAMWW